jgi:hypothetical protein
MTHAEQLMLILALDILSHKNAVCLQFTRRRRRRRTKKKERKMKLFECVLEHV